MTDEVINGIRCADDVAAKLENAVEQGSGWLASCPAHEDLQASLSIHDGEKGIVVKCHAGCTQSEVIDALKDIDAWPRYKKRQQKIGNKEITATYDYFNDTGDLVFQVVRFHPKSFAQRRPDGEGNWVWGLTAGTYCRKAGKGDWRKKKNNQQIPDGYEAKEFKAVSRLPIYNLSTVANNADRGIFVVEGEKDAENLSAHDLVVTTFVRGTGKWRKEYAQWFRGRDVFLLPDNDDAGRNGMRKVASELVKVARSVRIIYLPGLPEKGDVSDWLAQDDLVTYDKKTLLKEFITKTDALDKPTQKEIQQQEQSQDSSQQELSKAIQRHGFVNWPNSTDKNKPLATIANTEHLLSMHDITVRYNVIKKDLEIFIPGRQFTVDNASNCSMAEIRSLASMHQLPVEGLNEYTAYLADQNAYNPVAAWICSKEWDGENRYPQLLESLDAKDYEIASILLWRWLITCVAAAFEPDGIAAGGVLVLQGDQYIGKTSWFWSLLGGNREWGKEGAILNTNDKDSVIQCISYWIVELGELDATFRKSDLSALKGFITRDYDQIRRPYARGDSRYPRRTAFFGSVNPKQYLHDETGNRRFWTIQCGHKLNPHHGIDMQQLWAQVYVKYMEGARWMLTKDEVFRLNEHNKEFEAIHPIEELILQNYDFNSKKESWREATATQVLMELGYNQDRIKRSDRNACSDALRKILRRDSVKKHAGRVFTMPEKLDKGGQNRFMLT